MAEAIYSSTRWVMLGRDGIPHATSRDRCARKPNQHVPAHAIVRESSEVEPEDLRPHASCVACRKGRSLRRRTEGAKRRGIRQTRRRENKTKQQNKTNKKKIPKKQGQKSSATCEGGSTTPFDIKAAAAAGESWRWRSSPS